MLVLRYFLGLSDSEIAADLGVSRGTVVSTASRALAALARKAGASMKGREDMPVQVEERLRDAFRAAADATPPAICPACLICPELSGQRICG